MKKPLLFLTALCATASLVLANTRGGVQVRSGPNAGGTIIVHDPNLAYTVDNSSYCGTGSPPSSCQSADTRLDGSNDANKKVWKVYAAFPDGSSPRLKGMSWGVHYPQPNITIVAFGPCIGDLNNGAAEFPGAGWPGNDTGTAIVWQFTQTSQLVQAYWFAGYNYYAPQPQLFCLRDNPDPNLGGYFGDDSVPPQLDPIAGYGCLGFDRDGTLACPTTAGACCAPDGTCTLLPQGECLPPNTWNGAPSCDPNPCAQPNGACCDPDGFCILTTQLDCSGNWMGPGTVCDPNPCPQPGKVYYFSGANHGCPGDQVELYVNATNGVPIKGYSINFDFNPAAFEFVSQDLNGTRGLGAIQPTFSNTDHSVTADVVFSNSCPPSIPAGDGPMLHVVLRIKATAPVGPTTLDLTDAPPALNRMTTCLPHTLEPDLTDGTFDVDDCRGACCYPDGHCVYALHADCPTGDWRQGILCDPNPCPQPEGACCYPDGHCVFTTLVNCPTGDWREGVPCDPNPCAQPAGACCYPDGHCTFVNQSECPTGDWRQGVSCDPNPCTQPSGACCYPDGHCVFTTQANCPTGDWRANVPCDPNPCTQPLGACCAPNGTCTMTTQSGCPPPNVWHGDQICDPNPCPPPSGVGACCFTNAQCRILPPDRCARLRGTYLGDGTVCDPNPCPHHAPAEYGGCCLASGECVLDLESECASQNGSYLGVGNGCDPNPCSASGSSSTWGQIKSHYR